MTHEMAAQSPLWNRDTIRDVERASIFKFVASCADQLTGRVLDYGCGLQPYREIVEAAGGDYVGYDRAAFPANVSGRDVGEASLGDWHDAVVCTQVAQYWPDPYYELAVQISNRLRPRHGHLILTYPTCWDEVEPDDLWRFTRAGMERLLARAGFEVLRHERRAEVAVGGFRFPLGYGVLARAS